MGFLERFSLPIVLILLFASNFVEASFLAGCNMSMRAEYLRLFGTTRPL